MRCVRISTAALR